MNASLDWKDEDEASVEIEGDGYVAPMTNKDVMIGIELLDRLGDTNDDAEDDVFLWVVED